MKYLSDVRTLKSGPKPAKIILWNIPISGKWISWKVFIITYENYIVLFTYLLKSIWSDDYTLTLYVDENFTTQDWFDHG